jgi:hypothetical protein
MRTSICGIGLLAASLKNEFKVEIWEEWALTYGRNGSSERKNT